jgi:hypothetical protein
METTVSSAGTSSAAGASVAAGSDSAGASVEAASDSAGASVAAGAQAANKMPTTIKIARLLESTFFIFSSPWQYIGIDQQSLVMMLEYGFFTTFSIQFLI